MERKLPQACAGRLSEATLRLLKIETDRGIKFKLEQGCAP
jgi:hypothetical protein